MAKPQRPILDPMKIPGMKESFPAPRVAHYNGHTYDLTNAADLKAFEKRLPPPGAKQQGAAKK